LADHTWIIAIFLIAFGFFAIFKGKELFEFTIGILGAGLTFIFSMALFSLFGMLDYLNSKEDDDFFDLMLSVTLAILIGIIAGYLLFKGGCLVGVLSLGTVIGFFFGMTIYNMIFFNTGALWLLVLLSVGGSIAFGV
jgi:hypothetical protein